MRSVTGLLLAAAATQVGCARLFAIDWEDVDAACVDNIGGEQRLEAEVRLYQRRLNCYRRYVNMNDLYVNDRVQDAVENHKLYLEENRILEAAAGAGFNPFIEVRSNPFFTGANAVERLRYTSAIPGPGAEGQLGQGQGQGQQGQQGGFGAQQWTGWEVFYREFDPVDADRHMEVPFIRDVVFQPGFQGMGMTTLRYEVPGIGGVVGAYENVLITVGGTPRGADWPVVYPVDGQINVPTQYEVFFKDNANPLYVADFIGFPLTVTMGGGSALGAVNNPYNIQLRGAVVKDENGNDVDYVATIPRGYPWGQMTNTVVVAPTRPLAPNTTYTFELTLSNRDSLDIRVETSFTTLRVGDGTAVDPGGDTGAAGGETQ